MNIRVLTIWLCSLPLLAQAPAKAVWQPQRDIPLHGIAEMAYGHRSYTRLIAIYNQLESMERAPKGSVIETPPFPELFRNVGLLPRYQKPFDDIFFVIEDFPKTIREIRALKQNTGLTEQESEASQVAIRTRFASYAAKLEKAVTAFETQTTGDHTPKHMLARLKTASGYFKTWGEKPYDPNLRHDKQMDFVRQQLARALANAVAWSRE